ncbi:putative IS1294 ORF domain protein [Escherichia coli 3-267-03_S4_C2]|nr:putative IS1294 ORF domain protein [Escherichia coli 3-267-03_S4_C2]KEL81405.1 putative IS1294 ORF domain protein [Escherichia coli 5-366-08_S3_C2]
MSPRYVSLFAWSIFIPSKAVFYPPSRIAGHLSCISQGYASAGLYPARFSSALTHSAPRLHDGTPSPPSTQHTFERVTIQELLHHLHIAHFRHWFRFIHPQSTVHLRQLLSIHPVGKEPEVPHHLKKLLRDVLFQPRDQLPLHQRFRRRLSCIVVQVTEAQASPSVVMRQPGGCYRQLLQITTRIARRILPVGRFLRHVNMPVFPAGLSASDLSTEIPS